MQISSTPAAAPPANAYKTLFAGGAADPAAGAVAASLGDDPAVKQFLDYAGMTPAQQMRAAILGQMGKTEADLDKMDPKERKQIEDKIAAQIKQEVEYGDGKHKGVLVDVMA